MGEHIEGTLGEATAEALQGIEGLHQVAPAGIKLPEHLLQGLLRPPEGLQGRYLRNGGGVGGALALKRRHGLYELLGAQGPAYPPAGHGIGLGNTVYHHCFFPEFRAQGGDAHMAEAVIQELFVNLVGDDDEPVLQGHLGHGLQGSPVVGKPGGV